MLQPARPFVTGKNNVSATEIIEGIPENHRQVLLIGPKETGKTTCLRNLANNLDYHGEGPVLYCSSIEIYAAIFIRENETFLKKLSDSPIAIIDDLELLMQKEEGDGVLSLLMKERAGRGLSTILASDVTLPELTRGFPLSNLYQFELAKIGPLTNDELAEYVQALTAYYKAEQSPHISEAAIPFILERCDGMETIDKAIRFLMTASDCQPCETLSTDRIAHLLFT